MFKSASAFCLHIEDIVKKSKISHMDAVLKYCADNFIEPEDIKSLVNKPLKDKLARDMREANLLPKQAMLDV